MMLISGYLWCGFAAVWMLWAVRTKPTERREGARSRLFYMMLLPVGFYLIFARNLLLARHLPIAFLNDPFVPPDHWIRTVGIAITAVGLLFAVWARFYLGGNWSGTVTLKVGHELVRSGPYRWVRHPIYSGLLVAALGTAAERGELRGILGLLLMFAGFWMKIRTEEQFMKAAFGSEYDDYARTTGALIPRLRI